MGREKLRDVIFEQARFFLTNAGEFYPFGAFINTEGSIVPLGIQLENDHPQPQEVITILEQAVIQKISNKEAEAVGIGIDVFYKPTGETEKKSAIQVRILSATGESIDYYLPYQKEGNDFFYEEPFSEVGTLMRDN